MHFSSANLFSGTSDTPTLVPAPWFWLRSNGAFRQVQANCLIRPRRRSKECLGGPGRVCKQPAHVCYARPYQHCCALQRPDVCDREGQMSKKGTSVTRPADISPNSLFGSSESEALRFTEHASPIMLEISKHTSLPPTLSIRDPQRPSQTPHGPRPLNRRCWALLGPTSQLSEVCCRSAAGASPS